MSELYKHIEALGKAHGFKNITVLCKAANVSRSTMGELNNGRTATITAATAKKFADVLGVSMDEVYGTKNKPLVNDDEELTELLERVRDDPHMRMLFSITKDATPEDIEKAIKIIQTLKGD